jgi:hypothetical protein
MDTEVIYRADDPDVKAYQAGGEELGALARTRARDNIAAFLEDREAVLCALRLNMDGRERAYARLLIASVAICRDELLVWAREGSRC